MSRAGAPPHVPAWALLFCAIASASSFAMLLLGKLAFATSNEWVGSSAMLPLVVAMGSFVWVAKEWFKPTERRTPEWLK